MTRQVKRRIEVTSTPNVTIAGSDIRIESRGYAGNTLYTAHGDLSPYCAARLVKELRRTLRKLRDEKVSYYNNMVASAEEAL